MRRAAFLAGLAVAVVACGLSVTGIGPEEHAEAGVDAQAPLLDTGASSDREDTGLPCDAGAGAFCDYCDPALVLCLELDGGLVDQSSYHHTIDLDGGGTPMFAVEGSARPISLDGSFQMTFVPGAKLHANELFSVEVRAKLRSLPPIAGRFGLFDRDGIAGMFIYGGDGGAGQPRLRCAGNDVVVPFKTDRYMYFTCTASAPDQRVRIYVDGVPVLEGDSGVPVPPDGGWERHLVLLGNDPQGDDFQGEVASVRMFTRIRSADEIAQAADAGP